MSFTAAWGGRCASEQCSTPIEPGDDVIYVDDELFHDACASDAAPVERPTRAICQTCWIEIAANGTCLC